MAFSFLWMMSLLGGTLYVLGRRPAFTLPKGAGWMLIGIALLARLAPNALLAETSNFDIQSFFLTAEALSKGQDVYNYPATQNRHPYLPLQMYALSGAYSVSRRLGWPFPFTVRLLPLAVDATLAGWVFASLRRTAPAGEAFRMGLAHALNPAAVFVSACHGQFDALPAALTFGALLAIPRSAWQAGGLLGLAVLDKSWPVLVLPQLMVHLRSWRPRAVVAGGMAAVLLTGVALYAWLFDASLLNSVRPALTYQWGVGIWGYTYLLHMALMQLPGWPQSWGWFLGASRWVTLGILGGVWWARARRQPPARGVLSVLLGFLAWGHAFSIQYLSWPLVFAAYMQERVWLARFTLASSAYMFLAYYTLIFQNAITRLLPWPQADWFIIIPAGMPAWLVAVFWLRASLRAGGTAAEGG